MITTPLNVETIPLPLNKTSGAEVSKAGKGFSDLLTSTIEQVNQADHKHDTAITKMHTGEAKNLHEIMISSEEADISIRMLVQMRNKALEAYNEIMRMQI